MIKYEFLSNIDRDMDFGGFGTVVVVIKDFRAICFDASRRVKSRTFHIINEHVHMFCLHLFVVFIISMRERAKSG